MSKQKIFIIDGKKPCSKCKENLPIENFCHDKQTITELSSRCNFCKGDMYKNIEKIQIEETKICSICKESKLYEKFHKNIRTKDGYHYECIDCAELKRQDWIKNLNPIQLENFKKRKAEQFRKTYGTRKEKDSEWKKQDRKNNPLKYRTKELLKYGITPEIHDKMIKEQNNCCVICKKPETSIDPSTNKLRALSIDHDHNTGKVRALLCGKCNTSLGGFKDSIENLQNAIKYLEKFKI